MNGGFPGGPGIGGGIERPGRPGRLPHGPERPGSPWRRPERLGRPGGPKTPTPKAEPRWSGRIRMGVADPVRVGEVTVRRYKLDPAVRPVVIDRARAVQIGRHQWQFNEYDYLMGRATASVEHLLRGRPGLRRALAGLVADPSSARANAAFRRRLPAGSPITYGRPRFTETSGPRITRITAHVDERGRFVVKGSTGVQEGSWGIQRNKFRFQAPRPELSLAYVLRDRADLVRSLATVLRYPGNQAVQRSLEGRLAGAYSRLGGLISELHGLIHGRGGLSVHGGIAVQLGPGNIRRDTVGLEVRKVILTGWGSAGRLGVDRPGEGPGPGLLRIEQGHRRRAGLEGPGIRPGETGLAGPGPQSMIVPSALHSMATEAISTLRPGRQHLVPRLAAELSAALDAVTPFERHADLALTARVLLHDGMFRLGTRPAEPGHRGPGNGLAAGLRVELMSRPAGAGTGADAGHAMVFVVGGQPEAPSRSIAGPTAPGSGTGQARAGPAGRAGGTGPVAAVIMGSVLLIAAGRRVLDADAVVRFARRAILSGTYTGSPASAAMVMRLASALELVVLLDLALNGGMWIDVNPATGRAAATLLIDGFPGDPGGAMRFLQAEQRG